LHQASMEKFDIHRGCTTICGYMLAVTRRIDLNPDLNQGIKIKKSSKKSYAVLKFV